MSIYHVSVFVNNMLVRVLAAYTEEQAIQRRRSLMDEIALMDANWESTPVVSLPFTFDGPSPAEGWMYMAHVVEFYYTKEDGTTVLAGAMAYPSSYSAKVQYTQWAEAYAGNPHVQVAEPKVVFDVDAYNNAQKSGLWKASAYFQG